MATGASTADLAVILVDARKGVLTQTRRHSYIVSLLGIRHVVLAVNKMDLVGYDQASSTRSSNDYRELRRAARHRRRHLHPDVGAEGRQRHERAAAMPWYHGPTLLEYSRRSRSTTTARGAVPHAGAVGQPARSTSAASPARSRPARVRPGDEVVVLPSGREQRSRASSPSDGDLDERGRRPVASR
jgi:bifunctional enzyme CysN/CysC